MNSAKGSKFAILTDTTLCTGCEECVKACKETNQLAGDEYQRWKGDIYDLSTTRLTTIVRKPDGLFVRRQCRHCESPACVSVCIVGALQKTDEGPVIYDEKKCIGCRYCMLACPYGIPRYEWGEAFPYVRKCTFCYDKIMSGELDKPACVAACPEKATIFGTRDEMIREAKNRIAASPGKYWQDQLVGESEVGGTSVMYLSDKPLDFLGWKEDLGDQPLPELTAASINMVPPTILVVGGVMSAIWWIIGRRMALQAHGHTEDVQINVPLIEDKEGGDTSEPSNGREIQK
jgi:formate dehydrogenase iron-sulfur subunit